MDKVRLGRILGQGARQAARTAWDAIDAATAPDPNAKPGTPSNRQGRGSPATPPLRSPQNPTQPSRDAVVSGIARAVDAAQTIERGKRQMKQAALAPIKRAGRALWLEVTGGFFAIFALGFAFNAFRLKDHFHAGDPQRNVIFFNAALFLLFAYFSISSFHRARK